MYKMKNLPGILSSPNVAVKLEASNIFQLDNPISTKKSVSANSTKRILRKRSSSRIKPTPELVGCLQAASQAYQKTVSTSDVQILKSDFHGVDLEVKKSKCFSFVGLKGIVIKETFSTFVLADSATKSKSFTIPKTGCIFSIRRNGVIQLINGDQMMCSSGMRTTKKFKSKPTFSLTWVKRLMSDKAAEPAAPSIIGILLLRKTPNVSVVAAEYDLSKVGFFMRNSVQEVMVFFAKKVAEKTAVGVRQSVIEERTGNIGHVYCNLFGLAGVVVCSENYPARVAFGLTDKALDLFSKRVEKEIWMSSSRPIDSPWLKEMFNTFKNPAEADSLVRVQKELDETKVVLHKTIESLLDRGEKLDDLVSKSNELGILSKTFLKDTKKTNSCCVIQ